jgi:hypothetical protein
MTSFRFVSPRPVSYHARGFRVISPFHSKAPRRYHQSFGTACRMTHFGPHTARCRGSLIGSSATRLAAPLGRALLVNNPSCVPAPVTTRPGAASPIVGAVPGFFHHRSNPDEHPDKRQSS